MNEPLWWATLNIDAAEFERSKYAGLTPGKFRLKDLGVMRKLAPGIYESAAEEVKEYSDFLAYSDKNVKKVRLGRKLGSIPLVDAGLNPELMHDPKAQDKYFKLHPELKVQGVKKYA